MSIDSHAPSKRDSDSVSPIDAAGLQVFLRALVTGHLRHVVCIPEGM